MSFMEWVQTRLVAHDYDPGVVDGLWGRNTRSAVIAFQRAHAIRADGRLTAATVEALRAAPTRSARPTAAPDRDVIDHMPWMALALRKKGLHETANNAELRRFLRSDGPTLGDPARLPWCGDFVETCIAVTLPEAALPTNPYLARNWLSFGQAVQPCFGAVLVFWRGALQGTKGHVGFYYSEDDQHFHVLGGNQSNRVSIARLAKSRLLGARLPLVDGPYPRQRVRGAGDFALTTNEA